MIVQRRHLGGRYPLSPRRNIPKSIRPTADGGLERTASVPDDAACTMSALFYRQSNPARHEIFLTLESATNINTLFIDDGLNGLYIYSQSGNALVLNAPPTGTWIWAAMVCNGPGAGNLTGYASVFPFTTVNVASTTGEAAYTPTSMKVGFTLHSVSWIDGNLAAIKVWNAVLTRQELERERWAVVPQRWENLHLWSPIGGTDDIEDYGPDKRHWTSSGSPVTDEGPPIPWDLPGRRVSYFFMPTGVGPILSGPHAAIALGVGARIIQPQIVRAAIASGVITQVFQAQKVLTGTALGVGASTRQTQPAAFAGVATGVGVVSTIKTFIAATQAAVATAVGALTTQTQKTLAATATGVGVLVLQARALFASVVTGVAAAILQARPSTFAATAIGVGTVSTIKVLIAATQAAVASVLGAFTAQTRVTRAATAIGSGALTFQARITQAATAIGVGALTAGKIIAAATQAAIAVGVGAITTVLNPVRALRHWLRLMSPLNQGVLGRADSAGAHGSRRRL